MSMTRYVVVDADKNYLSRKYPRILFTDHIKEAKFFLTMQSAQRWAEKLGAHGVNICVLEISDRGLAWVHSK